MQLFQRIFFAAVLAGLVAGLGYAAFQQWRVAPLILEAETYEAAAPADHAHEADTPAHEHDAAAWVPQDGAERVFYTVLADVLVAVGFSFLLAAVSVLGGIEITAKNGVLFGLAGFVALQLAPAIGLPPELPGMAAADLGARQIWWIATALATGTGIFIVAKFCNWTAIAVGAALMLAPHIVGAPATPVEHGVVPAYLATTFAASTLAASALFWLTIGPLLGYLNERFARARLFAAKGAHA
jgi:cobalt transporter subunit CbtA